MKHCILIITSILLLCGCSKEEAPEPQTHSDTAHDDAQPEAVIDSTHHVHHQEGVMQELTYYLQRHNVQDEGFDMVARYAEEGDSTLYAYMPSGQFKPTSFHHWKNHPREGKCVAIDRQGRFIIGTFHADTLVSGIRIDSLGIYAGQFNRWMQACGHGSYRHADGSYYEGHWQSDRRNGFGFCVSPTFLKAGHWKNGRFKGERMNYHSDRIYGIDISRYQHEQGRKRFAINWQRLRITHLGRRISHERISGTVDYPVSFVYIKATEGISIKNNYFDGDYQACRRQRIPVGAYHFFSTRQDVRVQAQHFLQHAHIKKGDLPPMLDIEPSDARIEEMGGSLVLFSRIRTWLKIVERATGTRPLLYVNQRFVNTYLDQAPDLKQDYSFWIARYGEYKPDIHLSLWQLSADGRVNGITPDVDINVFNGYQGQWEEFLREACVK